MGRVPRSATLWTQLDAFVVGYHKARVIRLDDAASPHGILEAYDAWDRDPCSVDRANDVVRAIGRILDDALVADPGVRYITILGADDQIPMARLRDATRVANEHGRAADFAGQANALVGSLSAGMVLSDDAYTSARPLAVGGRELFVPEQSAGRLVESPSQIGSAPGLLHGPEWGAPLLVDESDDRLQLLDRRRPIRRSLP